jgi:hypothetical protein
MLRVMTAMPALGLGDERRERDGSDGLQEND